MANAKRLDLHRALDLAVEACAVAARDGWRVYDIDKLRGAPDADPRLRVRAVKAEGGGYLRAVCCIPLKSEGRYLNLQDGLKWVARCGKECRGAPTKATARQGGRTGAVNKETQMNPAL